MKIKPNCLVEFSKANPEQH